MTLIRKLKDLRHRLFYAMLLKRDFKLVTLCAPGSICPWTICPDGLDEKSIVHSGGIGSDISFEHELVRRYGCHIVLYDPSPTGVRTMALPENKIPQFHFVPFALAGNHGTLKIAPPLQPDGDAWFPRADAAGTLEVPCIDLQTSMKQSGHQHIDLLKLDIEGSEYEVIDNLLQNRIPVRQICVEFHHAILPGYRRSQTVRAIRKLILNGYKLICREGENLTFIKHHAKVPRDSTGASGISAPPRQQPSDFEPQRRAETESPEKRESNRDRDGCVDAEPHERAPTPADPPER